MNAVFQGGGIKGLAYIGAMRYLEERGLRIENTVGTSVGAIIAALIAARFDSNELERVLNQTDSDTLWPKKNKNKLSNTFSTIKKGYLYDMKPLEDMLGLLLASKGVRTFHDVKVGSNYKVKMIAMDVKKRKSIILPDDLKDYGLNPDSFPIAKAACMSSALPLIYPPYKINNEIFIDGGVADNFPIWMFNNKVIGFRVTKEKKFLNYARNKIFSTPNLRGDNIIYIDTSDYKATDFVKGFNERYKLYNLGYYYTKKFFADYFQK